MTEPTVKGDVAPGFEPLRRVFHESLRRGEEWGAGVCVWHAGKVVADLWGGDADRSRGVPWSEEEEAPFIGTRRWPDQPARG